MNGRSTRVRRPCPQPTVVRPDATFYLGAWWLYVQRRFAINFKLAIAAAISQVLPYERKDRSSFHDSLSMSFTDTEPRPLQECKNKGLWKWFGTCSPPRESRPA